MGFPGAVGAATTSINAGTEIIWCYGKEYTLA
jgi:hypothetical protein